MAIVYVDIKNTSGVEDGSEAHPYSKIQKAVDAASAWDTVKVVAGTYQEGVSINKSVNLEGAGEDKTIISFDPGNPHNPIVYITTDDVKISRFTITSPNRTGTGIVIRNANRITISENKLNGLSAGYGVEVRESASYVKISSNTVTNNGYGILFRQAGGGGYSNNTIENNTVTNNSNGNINLNDTTNSIIKNNKVKGGSQYYAGIMLSQRCSYNVIESNEIESTFGAGIQLVVLNGMAPAYNTITRNTVKLNPYGISIWAGLPKSSNNKIYHNNVIDNKTQAGDDGENNSWDNGAWEGNYWSDYAGEDTNGDGIGDTKLPHLGLDSHPLMRPFEIDITPPSAPTLVQPPSPTKKTPITLTGSAETNSTVQVFVNGGARGSVMTSETGSFSIEVDLDEGKNIITAKAIDAAGNIGAESQSVVVTLDTFPPDTPMLKSLPSTTTKVKIVVAGNAEPNAKVEIFVNQALKGSSVANGAGDFTIEVALEAGMNAITATATDAVGNISKPSAPVSVLYQSPDDINIALNLNRSGYPHPLESDSGWGGGSDKWEILDGKRTYPGEWAHGLAFTGGRGYVESCGIRQATINFGEQKTFHKVIVWHHGHAHIPKECKLQYWDGAKWIDINSERHVDLTFSSGWSDPDTHTFTPVTGSKVKYLFDNCGQNILDAPNEHGWIYEFEVFGETAPVQELPFANIPVINIEGIGDTHAKRLEMHGVKTLRDMALADAFTLNKKTGISLITLYTWKLKAVLAIGIKIDRTLFGNILQMQLGDIIAMPDEELSRKANQPIEVISGLKRDISTLLISLDNSAVKAMTLKRLT